MEQTYPRPRRHGDFKETVMKFNLRRMIGGDFHYCDYADKMSAVEYAHRLSMRI
jgi:hypothetical protein